MNARREILRDADSFNGGFDTAPKFPNEPTLMFLLQLAAGHNDKEALEAVTRTLDYMLDGGIHDHVGGGFHRYATDNLWRIPHFEKMLYNQAQMVRVLLQAYRLTGTEALCACSRAHDFICRTSHDFKAKGAFFQHGMQIVRVVKAFFMSGRVEQLKEVLGNREGMLAAKIFGVTDEGNFEGRTILHFPEHPEQLASTLKLTNKQFDEAVSRFRSKLDEARNKRVPPHLDEKVVLSWNGMMIAAIAEAALVLKETSNMKKWQKRRFSSLTKT